MLQILGSKAVRRGVAAGMLAVGTMLAQSSGVSAVTYTFHNLGLTTTPTAGNAINSSNEVVGFIGGGPLPGYSTGLGTMQSFGNSSDSPATANAVNAGGIAVGYTSSAGNPLAFHSNPTAGSPSLTLLPIAVTGSTTGPATTSTGNGVSGNATVYTVVGSYDDSGSIRSFAWNNGDAALTSLDNADGTTGLGGSSIPGSSSSVAYGVSGNLVVGQADLADTSSHAYYYSLTSHVMHDMGTASGSGNSIATAVNSAGLIVGQTDTPSTSAQQAFVYSTAGGFTSIGSLDGNDSEAFAINIDGEVVGYSSAGGGEHAFVWTSSSGIQDLNLLAAATLPSGFTLDEARGVNDAGYITGIADDGSNTYAFELAPSAIPEPASIGLLTVGIGMLSTRRRRRYD